MGIVRLVGVDEREVEPLPRRQGPQRLDRGRDAQLDLVVDAGALPVLPGDGGPLLVDVAAQERAVVRQATGDADRRVPGERPDLDRVPGADEARQQCHERPLLGSDLHHRDAAERLGLGDEVPLHVVERRRVGDEVIVDGLGEEERLRCVRHATEATRARTGAVPPRRSACRTRA